MSLTVVPGGEAISSPPDASNHPPDQDLLFKRLCLMVDGMFKEFVEATKEGKTLNASLIRELRQCIHDVQAQIQEREAVSEEEEPFGLTLERLRRAYAYLQEKESGKAHGSENGVER
ncbi:MAG: hypothetical protein KY468_15215 [Armatimonadetes bacterium]|nr:hypothetical protein [Armatimonadota bacterium]